MDRNLVRVFVDNLEISALVDTGATISVISESLRQRLKKIALPYDCKQLRGVGKDLLHPIGTCTARVKVSENVVIPVSFVVLRQCSHDLILGLDFLYDHGALISCQTSELSLSPFPSLDYWSSTDTPNVLGCLSLRCTTSIPPSTGIWLPVTSLTTRTRAGLIDVVTKANQNILLRYDVIMPRSIVSIEDGETHIWAVNVGFQTCILPTGLTVASFCTLQDSEELFPVSEDGSLPRAEDNVSSDEQLKQMIAVHLSDQQKLQILKILRSYESSFYLKKKNHGPSTECPSYHRHTGPNAYPATALSSFPT